MALVTDYVSTYVVFNYFNITWIGSNYYQNCDPSTGQSSASNPDCIPAQVSQATALRARTVQIWVCERRTRVVAIDTVEA